MVLHFNVTLLRKCIFIPNKDWSSFAQHLLETIDYDDHIQYVSRKNDQKLNLLSNALDLMPKELIQMIRSYVPECIITSKEYFQRLCHIELCFEIVKMVMLLKEV